MKKRLVPIVAVLALALALPAVSAAKSKHYAGTLSPSGTVSFKVNKIVKKGKKGKKKKTSTTVSNFTFDSVPITCTDGAHTTRGLITFSVKLRGSFNIDGESSATGAKVQIQGTTTAGTLHVSGNVPIDGTQNLGDTCDSGVLSWTAART
jgi:hypothetical protein